MAAAPFRRPIGFAAFALWLVSLPLPAVTHCGDGAMQGWMLALLGPLGVFDAQFGWLANVFMFWGIGRLLLRKRIGFISTGMGLGLAASAFFWKRSRTDAGYSTVCSLDIGFYFWLACGVLLLTAAFRESGWFKAQNGVNAGSQADS